MLKADHQIYLKYFTFICEDKFNCCRQRFGERIPLLPQITSTNGRQNAMCSPLNTEFITIHKYYSPWFESFIAIFWIFDQIYF